MREEHSRKPALQNALELRRKLESARTQERRARLDDAANEAERAFYHVLRINPPETTERNTSSLAARKPRIDANRILKTWTHHKTVENVRRQLTLLVSTPSNHNRIQTREAKQQASIWASRYATHAIVLLLLLGIAVCGGFKGLTVQAAAYSGDGSGSSIDTGGFADDTVNSSFGLYDVLNGDAAAKADIANRAQLLTNFPNRIKSYTVQQGDTLATLAAKFNLDKPTLMWANHIVDPDATLKPGDQMLILPVKGMYHEVQEGDTIDSIAAEYQVEPAAITSYKLNALQPPYTLNVGDTLIVPGGSLPPRDQVMNYTPHPGESVEAIAQKFGLSVATILLANPQIGDGSNISSDDQLLVPPIDGIVYMVAADDTVESVAHFYGIAPNVLTDYAPNHLKAGDALVPGSTLIIPGGTIPTPTPTAVPEPTETPVPAIVAETSRSSAATSRSSRDTSSTSTKAATTSRSGDDSGTKKPGSTQKPAPKRDDGGDTRSHSSGDGLVHGSFIWPSHGVITQGFWAWEAGRRHGGLDIANSSGTSIVAADGGEVVWSGWRTDGFGNCVMIDHHNGYLTIYGHMRSHPAVYVGQWVSRGQYLGPMGSTGWSTGPHLHFAIKRNGVLRDPLGYLN